MTEIHQPDLGPSEPFEVAPGFLVVPLLTPTLPPATRTNCVLVGTDELVVVDPASPYADEQDRLAALLGELGKPVRAIWLTHHHADHVGGVNSLQASMDLPVRAHPATAQRLEGSIKVDDELLEGDTEEFEGLCVEALHTPGHARGHLAFRDQASRLLVAGDLVAGQGTIVIDPPEGDMADYLATLGRLVQGGTGTIIPAHGPAIPEGEERLLHYIAHRMRREEQVAEALCAVEEGALPIDLVRGVYPEVPVLFHPLAARQVLAHLLKLEAEGRVCRPDGSRGVPGEPVYMTTERRGPPVPDARFRWVG